MPIKDLWNNEASERGISMDSTILAVDDSVANIVILEELLADEYTLVTASSGRSAIELARSIYPDVVLLDIMMPEMDGYETCRILREDPDLCHVKIILISAKEETSDRLKGYKVGADDYITKPFEPEELLAKLKVFLRLKHVEELDQLKMDILHLLSHETRTPLSGILGSLMMLKTNGTLKDSDSKKLIEIAEQSGHQLQSLLEKSMLLCEIKSNVDKRLFEPVQLDSLVYKAADGLRLYAEERQVTVRLEISSNSRPLGCRDDLLLVPEFLLHNAIRFSPSKNEVRVSLTDEPNSVRLSVTDHGPGIPPNYLPHVFSAFTPRDITHHAEGHGLSLAICREIISRHGGIVGVDSNPGNMTCFFATLPLQNKLQGDKDNANELVHMRTPNYP